MYATIGQQPVSMPCCVTWIVVAVVVVLGFGAWRYHVRSKARRKVLGDLSSRMGWSFTPAEFQPYKAARLAHTIEAADLSDSEAEGAHKFFGRSQAVPEVVDAAQHFEVFRRGSMQTAFNTMKSACTFVGEQVPMVAGDLRCSVDRDDYAASYRREFSYVFVVLPVDTPALTVGPYGFLGRTLDAIDSESVETGDATFDKRFSVRAVPGSGERFVQRLLNDRMRTWFDEGFPGSLHVAHGRCMVLSAKGYWEPEEFEQAARWLDGFCAHWPAELI